MIDRLISFALRQRLIILLLSAALAIAGVWAFRGLPIDAFPDISAPQVQVIVKAPGMAPLEVEQRITLPLELEMQGLPRQTVLRSTTKYALSVIVIDFADGTDIYWARQQVAERLSAARTSLPAEVEAVLAPITTPLGELYMYRVEGKGLSNVELRGIQDWIVRPRLRTVDGVADVNSLGGEVRAFEVALRPQDLRRYGVTIEVVESALAQNNRNAGGDRINRGDEILLVRSIGNLTGVNDIGAVTVAVRDGRAVRVRDVADVRVAALTRYGAVTADASGEVVTGLVLLRKGANGRATVRGVKRALDELAPNLPANVRVVPFYDRSELIGDAVWTVEKALTEAVVLVLIVLLLMLGNVRTAITVALILPLSVLFTFVAMRLFDISANLMSLGGLAIAIGILVDAAVVVVENVYTRIEGAATLRREQVRAATLEVAAPVITGVAIIVIVFLPLFSLTGLEGKLFTPLAITISFALVGSLLLSLTAIPVIASLWLRPSATHRDMAWLAWLKQRYRLVIAWTLTHRAMTISVALVLLLGALILFPFLGKEFMPTMDEGTTVVIIEKKPTISLEASIAADVQYQTAMMSLPEVTGVVSRTGADELRLDPMGLYQTDNFILTRPRREWQRSVAQFQEDLRGKLAQFRDIEFSFTQPIDMRVSEMLTGVRSAMAVKLTGDDLALLEEKSKAIENVVSKVRGATDLFRAPLSGQAYLQIDIRRDVAARYGVNVEEINRALEIGVAGRVVTEILENNRRVGVLLRYPVAARSSAQAIGALLVDTPGGAQIPLAQVANIREVDGPVQIGRESARRTVTVQANVEGRDVVGFVDEARAAIARAVPLPRGYTLTFGGQFENQQRASARLALVVPIAIGLIFILLFFSFQSLAQAGLIILNIPFALIGGIVGLFAFGFYVSVPASVGFISLFGIAVLNGVVLVTYFNQLRAQGLDIEAAVTEGALRRLRPVLMTAAIASLGLLPMLLATGPGSELQRPLAAVVIGGLITSTLLTLVLLPTLYAWLEQRRVGR